MQEFWLSAGVHGFSIDSANLLVVNLEANAPDKEKIKVKNRCRPVNQCSCRIRRNFIASRIRINTLFLVKTEISAIKSADPGFGFRTRNEEFSVFNPNFFIPDLDLDFFPSWIRDQGIKNSGSRIRNTVKTINILRLFLTNRRVNQVKQVHYATKFNIFYF